MTNPYFTPTSVPVAQSRGSSSTIRAEIVLIEAGFDKLPTLAQVWGASGNYAADSGTANAYVVSVASTYILAYATGMEIRFKAANSNTGASSLNVNGLGAKTIVQPDGATALSAGHILASQMVTVVYDGTNFQMVGGGTTTFTNDPTQIQKQTYVKATTAGTSTAYTLSPSPTLSAYEAGVSYFITFDQASGANPTLTVSGLASPPNLVKQLPDGTFANISAAQIPANHRSRVTLLSPTQALVEDLPPPLGGIVGRGYGEYLSNADLATTIPQDDTIPQNTEGTQIISVSYTPKSTANRLRLRFRGDVASSGAPVFAIAAIFSSASANALAVARTALATIDYPYTLACEFEYVPGVTTALTFTVRVGAATAANLRFNGSSSARFFGGVSGATLVVEEIAG